MKKTFLALFCLLSLSFAAQAQIVITEIMYNPPESGTDSLEFLELYNNSNNTVDLTNWTLSGVTFTFPSMSLGPNQYVLTAVNAGAIQRQFGKTALQWEAGALNNSGEPLAVLNAVGDTIDKVTYLNAAPWPIEAAGQGPSLVLCDPNSDNSQVGNWQAATTSTGVTINGKLIYANPGAASACPTGVTAVNDQYVSVSGQNSTFPVLANDILPGQGGATLSITVAPQHGTATVNGNNTISYQSNSGYCGSDALAYRICEGSDCAEATVNITVRCYPQYTIDQINNLDVNGVADSLGKYCELTATVYGVNLRGTTGLQFTMIDDTNTGLTVFSATANYGYSVKEKDKITVRGVINQFNGLIQILPDTVFKVSANNTLVSPILTNNHSESTESKLIRIENLRYVDVAQWATGTGTGFSVFMVNDANPLDTIQVRIDNDVDLFNQPAPPAPFTLTGIGGQFDNTSPYTSGYQIAPRYTQDVSTLVGTHEADFSGLVQLTPNPASDYMLIRTTASFDGILIFNPAGQLIRSMEQPKAEEFLSLQNMAPGVYFMQFAKDGGIWTTRFVKL